MLKMDKILVLVLVALLCATMVLSVSAESAEWTSVSTEQELKDAMAGGGNVKLAADIELTATLNVAAGTTVKLDLAGYTVSYETDVVGADMLVNRGDLTIEDSSEAGTGTITFLNTDTTGNNVTMSTISTEPGSVLTVNGGNIINTSTANGSQVLVVYTIDALTNGTLGDVAVYINGGKIVSTYMAIRQFVNGTTDTNTLVVTGGTIEGTARAINVHVASNAMTAVNDCAILDVSGGTITSEGYAICVYGMSNNISISGGEINGWYWDYGPYNGFTDGAISGGEFSGEIDPADCAPGNEPTAVTDENGEVLYYTIQANEDAVASINGVGYLTLAEAVAAAKDGDEVVMLNDVDLGTEMLSIKKKLTLNLGDNTITSAYEGGYASIYVGTTGDLTVTGDGAITNTAGVAIGNYGKLTVSGGKIAGKDAAVYNYYYNETTYGTATISGGDLNTVWNCGVMEVTGGMVDYLDNTHALTVTDGVIIELAVNEADYAPVNGTTTTISGGMFGVEPEEQWLAACYVATKAENEEFYIVIKKCEGYGQWETAEAATKTTRGTEKRTCDNCGATQTRTVAASEVLVVELTGNKKIDIYPDKYVVGDHQGNVYEEVAFCGAYVFYGVQSSDVTFHNAEDADVTVYDATLHNVVMDAMQWSGMMELKPGVVLNLTAEGVNLVRASNHAAVKGGAANVETVVNLTVCENSSILFDCTEESEWASFGPMITLNILEGEAGELAENWRKQLLQIVNGAPAEAHTYDDIYDADCNICGNVREVEAPPQTGDPLCMIVLAALFSGTGIVTLTTKKYAK